MISHLGRFEILDVVGQGSMGIVYKAKDPLIDRIVAIKSINLSLAEKEQEEYTARLYQEAKAAGHLNHPNIITIYDVGKSGEVAYIAMEFLQGRELSDILKDGQILPIDQVLDIVAQVAIGLAYAHEHHIVHRDVKPSNIMVAHDGLVKITDFGIARMASSEIHTQTGLIIGSPKYMSPEQVMGKLTDQRSDIFSLGVVLYEMLTGQAPFVGENFDAISYKTLHAMPPPPGKLNPALPDMINFIVAKALAKRLDDRYQDAQEFANDLRTCRATTSHTNVLIDQSKLPPVTAVKQREASETVGRVDLETEESESSPTRGVSTAFDSFGATMRLAAISSTPEQVDKLSQTFKLAHTSMEASNQTSPAAESHKRMPLSAAAVQPIFTTPTVRNREDEAHYKLGNRLLIIIIALVMSGLAKLTEVVFF